MRKIIIILLLALSACYSELQTMQSYIGYSKKTLVLNYGNPALVQSDQNEGQIYIYSKHYYDPYYHLEYWTYKHFYITKNDIVYHVRIERQSVPPQQYNVEIRYR